LECDAEFGHYCTPGHYRGGLFWYCEGGSPVGVMKEDAIIGWDYYPYEEHPDAALEDMLFGFVKAFAKDVREGKAQWPIPKEIQNQSEV